MRGLLLVGTALLVPATVVDACSIPAAARVVGCAAIIGACSAGGGAECLEEGRGGVSWATTTCRSPSSSSSVPGTRSSSVCMLFFLCLWASFCHCVCMCV